MKDRDISEKLALAWAAGFFDGEGYIHCKGKYSTIYIGQKERESLDSFMSIVTWGKIHNKRDYVTPHGKATYMHMYYAGSTQGAMVLIKLLPYLRYKKQEALKAIEGQINRLKKRSKIEHNQLVNLYEAYKNTNG